MPVSSSDEPTPPHRRVCVFCGSNAGTDPAFLRAASDLGTELARRGTGLVYGGARVGLMGAVADACLAAGGSVTGVMPGHLVDREIAHDGLTDLVVTGSMHERKATMARLAHGFVALPGGFGTIEETVEVLTWNQLGLLSAPVVLLDVAGFYTPLLAWFDHAVSAGFLRPEHRTMVRVARDAAAAVDLALGAADDLPPKWIDLDRA